MKTYKIIIHTRTTRETYYEPRRLSATARAALNAAGCSYTQRLIDLGAERKHILAAKNHMEQAAAACCGASSVSHVFTMNAGLAQEALKKLENAIAGEMNLEG